MLTTMGKRDLLKAHRLPASDEGDETLYENGFRFLGFGLWC